MPKLITCQCADPVCGRGRANPCPRTATAEDLLCDPCRGAQTPNERVDLGYPSATEMIFWE
jgi:hypothetical protein